LPIEYKRYQDEIKMRDKQIELLKQAADMNTNDLVNRLASTERKAEELQQTLNEKDAELNELKAKTNNYENQLGVLLNKDDEYQKKIYEYENQIKFFNEEGGGEKIKQLENNIFKLNQEKEDNANKVKELEETIVRMTREDNKEDKQYEQRIKELEGTIAQMKMEEKFVDNSVYVNKIRELEATIVRLTSEDMKEDKQYEKRINELESIIENMKADEDRNVDQEAYERKIYELEEVVTGMKASEEELRKQFEFIAENGADKYIEQLKKNQVEKDLQINELSNKIIAYSMNEESNINF
jgi:chromosome segregation ATPase